MQPKELASLLEVIREADWEPEAWSSRPALIAGQAEMHLLPCPSDDVDDHVQLIAPVLVNGQEAVLVTQNPDMGQYDRLSVCLVNGTLVGHYFHDGGA